MPKIHLTSTTLRKQPVLIGIIKESQNEKPIGEFINELSFLTITARAIPVRSFLQRLEYPNYEGHILGKEKFREIAHFVEAKEY